MKLFFVVLCAVLIVPQVLWGVISPPGLGPSNTASWFVTGVQQYLDKKREIKSLTYAGVAHLSTTQSDNPLEKQGIFVLNEEVYHQWSPYWQYSLALSYRRQNEYEDGEDALNSNPATKQEFRAYGRYTFSLPFGQFKWTLAYRQEFRRFLSTNFENIDSLYQFRSRFKSQVIWKVDNAGKHRFTLAAEFLFSTSRLQSGLWTPFGYKETRLGFYYTLLPQETQVSYSVGYMNDIIGYGNSLVDDNYFTFEAVFLDPFS
ncbi:MAG: hypothetical protein JSR44_11205 [Spirochaetes bacterium]|nr:hypothetical protein [Spirochaetota bacterium]